VLLITAHGLIIHNGCGQAATALKQAKWPAKPNKQRTDAKPDAVVKAKQAVPALSHYLIGIVRSS